MCLTDPRCNGRVTSLFSKPITFLHFSTSSLVSPIIFFKHLDVISGLANHLPARLDVISGLAQWAPSHLLALRRRHRSPSHSWSQMEGTKYAKNMKCETEPWMHLESKVDHVENFWNSCSFYLLNAMFVLGIIVYVIFRSLWSEKKDELVTIFVPSFVVCLFVCLLPSFILSIF